MQSVNFNQIIDSSTLSDADEADEDNELPATRWQEAEALVFGFMKLGYFPDL
jgi:hypothetical protein